MSGQGNPWKQLCPLILHAASKYPVYGVEQLPRNSNECLQTGFVSSQEAFEKSFRVGITTGCDQRGHVKRSSQVTLHKGIAPLFLRSYQTFLPGEDLKTEMKKLNEHYSNLPQAVLDRGMMSFAKFPPADTEFLTTRLWDRFDPEWRELERNPPQLDPEMQAALLELVNRFKNESTPLHPQTYIPLEEVGQLTIEKQVSITRGKWHRYSPEIEATSKPRHIKPET